MTIQQRSDEVPAQVPRSHEDPAKDSRPSREVPRRSREGCEGCEGPAKVLGCCHKTTPPHAYKNRFSWEAQRPLRHPCIPGGYAPQTPVSLELGPQTPAPGMLALKPLYLGAAPSDRCPLDASPRTPILGGCTPKPDGMISPLGNDISSFEYSLAIYK